MVRTSTAMIAPRPAAAAVPALSDTVVVERITPLRAFTFAHVLWLVILLITPVSPRWPEEWLPVGVLATSMMSLAFGMMLPHIFGIRFRPVEWGGGNLRTMLRLCIVLGGIGLAFRVFDLLAVRGVNLTLAIEENRKASGESGASLISTVAALLAPLAFASLLVSWVAVRRGIAHRISSVALTIGLTVVLLPVALGSRSSLLLAVAQLGCLALLMLTRITSRMVGLAAAAGVGLVVVFAVLFAMRFQQLGFDYKFSARYSAYTQVTPLHEQYLAVIDSADPAFGISLAAYASILQYYIHGLFEFLYLVELKQEYFSYGNYQFFFIAKLFNVMTGRQSTLTYLDELAENPRAGVFQALYGPAYIDFGLFSFAFMLALGFLAETCRLRLVAGDVMLLPIYVFLLVTLLLAPCVSGFIMNAGSITLFSYFSLYCLSLVLRSVRGVR